MRSLLLLVASLVLGCGASPMPPGMSDCEATAIQFEDVDGDGFGFGDALEICPGTPGYAANAADCGPDDPRAFPGATAFQGVPMLGRFAGAPWDFDCNGSAELRWSRVGVCDRGYPTCQGPAFPERGGWRAGGPHPGLPPCGAVGLWMDSCRDVTGECEAVTSLRIQGCR